MEINNIVTMATACTFSQDHQNLGANLILVGRYTSSLYYCNVACGNFYPSDEPKYQDDICIYELFQENMENGRVFNSYIIFTSM